VIQAMSSCKRSKVEIDAAVEHICHLTIVIECGVLRSDTRVPPFQFIYQIFQQNGWLSVFNAVNIYPRLVHEFYMNLKPYSRYDTPHVDTIVYGTKLRVTLEVTNEVTGISLSFGITMPYPNFVTPPSMARLMECLNPDGEYEWEEHRNKIPISYMRAVKHLLARTVMQNIYPISHNSDVPLDWAWLIFAITQRVPFCLLRKW